MKVTYKYPLLTGEGGTEKKKRIMLCKQKGRMCILKYNNHPKEIKCKNTPKANFVWKKIMQSNFKKHKSFIQKVSMPGLKEND